MPIGEHLSRCRKCRKSFICGDCIAFECGDCRRKRWDAEQAKRGSEQRMVGGIVIPDRAPIGIREALRNFVEATAFLSTPAAKRLMLIQMTKKSAIAIYAIRCET